ncbi:MAG: hypothetical protein IJP96_11290 [Synergistaceae bacterium]|nr:hypothetical protein [Synergistaceae bacterium]MBR0252698.1 hypothetical protein [Synergistaceae bacterium]
MNEILWLSGLLVAVSGLFLIGGYLEHKKALFILENLSFIIFELELNQARDRRYRNEEINMIKSILKTI